MPDYPNWLLQLVAAVEHYEDIHSKVEEGEECFAGALEVVPDSVRSMARGYAQAKREAEGG